MAINNQTTASSSPLARTDTPQPTPPQQPAQGPQPPRLHAVEPRTSISALPNTSTSPAGVTHPPQLQAGRTPNSPRSQLRAAALDGDGRLVKHLLANLKPDVSVADPATGMTALMLAASAGHDDVVQLLTKDLQEDDIHRQNAHGDSALTVAAAAGHADVVKLLLVKGAKQAHKDAALARAAAAGQAAMISLLLKQGANVDRADASSSAIPAKPKLVDYMSRLARPTRGWCSLQKAMTSSHLTITSDLVAAHVARRAAPLSMDGNCSFETLPPAPLAVACTGQGRAFRARPS